MTQNIIEKIIDELDSNYRDDEEVLVEIYNRMALIASHYSNRDAGDNKLTPYITKATIEAYLRRGKEGTSGYSEGSESESYVDIEEKLRKDIVFVRRLP